MEHLIVIVFTLTYAGMALGRVPGLTLDRTGIALIAAVVLLASGQVGVSDAGAAIDMPTLLLLFALMLVSAQFQEAGLYRVVAGKVAVSAGSAGRLLALVILSAGLLSAVLANDIVVFAMTPMLVEGVKGRGMDPRPFLLGLAGGANAGSAMTIIGNPQNILIGQVGSLDFWHFILVCGVPAALSMLLVFWCVRLLWRRQLAIPPVPAAEGLVPPLDYWQTLKGVVAVLGLMVLFATDLPREVGALAVAAPLLLSRRLASRDMIGAVDWHLLVLFACLFVVTDAFAASPWAAMGVEWLAERQWLPDRITVMAPLLTVASNTIGNVPAVMLILSMWPIEGDGPLYGLALLSTLAGNLLLVGSLANIIVAERAAASGVKLTFTDFARAGIPMTIASLAVASGWLLLGRWMGW